ncbi:ROK family protein [Rhodoligotrophos defluvii]|uniref:ROK family protein n=1 Tax=Rhodoligotrophos defluvii TaxID=2561934 RepID=UPI001960FF65|nr:ROK family protein [Rhodoligotrophos defluvii]
MSPGRLRIGIDLGGTKIAAFALDETGRSIITLRRPTPRFDYGATLREIADMVAAIEAQVGTRGMVGIGMPGSLSPRTGRVRNANSTWLNDRPFGADLCRILAREIRFANDANCFALSEAADGAGQGFRCVFGVIIGTGCGAGVVVDGSILEGRHGIAGEWGHTPLPWPKADEFPGPECWCGRRGCLETWLSGPGFAADHERVTGQRSDARAIVVAARRGEPAAQASLARYCDRLARALAVVTDMLDPDLIVLGGGLSEIEEIYAMVPRAVTPHLFSDYGDVLILPPRHGADSGGRGAARLWDS